MTPDTALLAAAAGHGGEVSFAAGIMVTIAFIVVFVGSVWLLTAMILGAKLGYYVTGACLFAVMTLISLIWFATGLGPRGETGFWGDLGNETLWQQVAVGPELSQIETRWGTWDVSDFGTSPDWVVPTDDVQLADLDGEGAVAGELQNALPPMDALILAATSPIPGIREGAANRVQGEVNLDPGSFSTTDVLMKEVEVAGKDSLLALGWAVPTESLSSGDLGGREEARVSEYLVEPGTEVTPGTPVAALSQDGETFEVVSEQSGRLIEFGFRIDDLVKPGVPLATLDMSGQPDAPEPVQVAAVRVRGSIRVPAFIYLVVSVGLMILHLIGVSKIEKKAKLSQPQLA